MSPLDLFIVFLGLACMALYVDAYRDAKERRKAKLDDEVDFDDWKRGSPNDPVPDDAEQFKTNV